MAPPKRRPGGLDRPPKNSKKSKGGSGPVTYETSEDALDAGVVQEEKGERYRTGDKSLRHYEEAAKLYTLASSLDPSAYSPPYNLARVLFHTATTFLLPPRVEPTLRACIGEYRRALERTEGDRQLLVDAGFNLAEALLSLGDVLEDQASAADAPEATGGEKERREAVEVLVGVAKVQEELLNEANAGRGGEGALAAEEGEVDLGDEEMGVAPPMDGEDDAAAEGGGQTTRTWEESITTPSQLLDTHFLLLSTLLLLSTPASPHPSLDETLSRCKSLAPVCLASGVNRDLDVILAEANVRSSLLSPSSTSTDDWLVEGRQILSVLERAWADVQANPDAQLETRIETVCALGDTQSLLARLLLKSARSSTSPNLAQDLWTLLSASTTSSNTALALVTPPPTAFPSSASALPHPSTPSILLTLATLSIQRAILAHPPFHPAHPAAEKNHGQLLANALAYARRAADASKTGWATRALPPFSSMAPPAGTPTLVDGGWQAEQLAREAVLVYLRALYLRGGEADEQQGDAATAKTVVARAKGRMPPADVVAFVRALEEDEGGLVAVGGDAGKGERAFWSRVVESLEQ